jgi:hypothetical protein
MPEGQNAKIDCEIAKLWVCEILNREGSASANCRRTALAVKEAIADEAEEQKNNF